MSIDSCIKEFFKFNVYFAYVTMSILTIHNIENALMALAKIYNRS